MKALLKLGWAVTFTCRSDEKGAATIAEIESEFSSSVPVEYLKMDLVDLSSVRALASEFRKTGKNIDLLILNAGIMAIPFSKTIDGFESQYQVNHLGHFLLVHLLFDRLAPQSRVVALSSRAHLRWGNRPIDYTAVENETPQTYDPWLAYGRSKLCNILTVKALAKRFPKATSTFNFNAVYPGLVDTGLLNVAPGLSGQAKSVDEGIKPVLHCALSPATSEVSGEYFHDNCEVGSGPSEVSAIALDEEAADALWENSLRQIGISEAEFGRA